MDIIFREYGGIIWQKRGWFLLILLSISGAVGLDITIPLIYKRIANGLTEPFSPALYTLLLDSLGMIMLMYGTIWVCWRILEFSMIPFEGGGINILDQRCFEVLLRQRYSFFENNFSGSLVKQANRFIRSFESVTDWLIFQFYANLLAVSVSFVIFYRQQPLFALYFLLWAVLFVLWSVGYSVWKLKFDKRVAEWDSRLGGAYSDSIANIFIVKSFALERQEQGNVSTIARESFRRRTQAWLLMFLSFAVQSLLTMGIELLLVYLMIRKWKAGHFQVGEFVLFQSILLMLIHRMWDFGRYFRKFSDALADAREMAEIFRRTDVEHDNPTARAHAIEQGDIRFENLGFDYGKARSQTGLFKDFNLHIQPGEKVALVGHSGSGKTSLTKLLFRFVEPRQGRILLDGEDAQNFTLASLRRQIALVPQQPELFHRSIRDNIVLDKQLSETQLRTVASKARALDFIDKLPQGFDTLVGERGVKLSGGEKQRIAIARALLEDAPIVVLDEATSALDSLTEQQIQVAIFELIEHKTAIVIAHRLSTILRMDRIIVLENGQIIEQGSHTELLALGGRYQEMWRHQSGEFLTTD